MKLYYVYMRPSDVNNPESGVIATVAAYTPKQARDLVDSELTSAYGTSVSRVYQLPNEEFEPDNPELYEEFLGLVEPRILAVAENMRT